MSDTQRVVGPASRTTPTGYYVLFINYQPLIAKQQTGTGTFLQQGGNCFFWFHRNIGSLVKSLIARWRRFESTIAFSSQQVALITNASASPSVYIIISIGKWAEWRRWRKDEASHHIAYHTRNKQKREANAIRLQSCLDYEVMPCLLSLTII